MKNGVCWKAPFWMKISSNLLENLILSIAGVFCTTREKCGKPWIGLHGSQRRRTSFHHDLRGPRPEDEGMAFRQENILLESAPVSGGVGIFIPYLVLRGLVGENLFRLKNPMSRYREYSKKRGMSKYHDWIDWLGGYPYETANFPEIQGFLETRNFILVNHCLQESIFRRQKTT